MPAIADPSLHLCIGNGSCGELPTYWNPGGGEGNWHTSRFWPTCRPTMTLPDGQACIPLRWVAISRKRILGVPFICAHLNTLRSTFAPIMTDPLGQQCMVAPPAEH